MKKLIQFALPLDAINKASERIRQAAAAGDEPGDDHGEASEGAGARGPVREPGALAVFCGERER